MANSVLTVGSGAVGLPRKYPGSDSENKASWWCVVLAGGDPSDNVHGSPTGTNDEGDDCTVNSHFRIITAAIVVDLGSPRDIDKLLFRAKMQDYDLLLEEIFDEYDAILTPATPGPAPAGIEATGSPVMNTIWTFCGTPAINVPLLQSAEGLPIGVQVVGAKGDDARLFRSTRWLLDVLNT